ncbi:MAG: serine/threonine-protein kinase [Polyangiaceae bacterium]
MSKLDVKEVRSGWRDPRAEETEPPGASSAPERPASPAVPRVGRARPAPSSPVARSASGVEPRPPTPPTTALRIGSNAPTPVVPMPAIRTPAVPMPAVRAAAAPTPAAPMPAAPTPAAPMPAAKAAAPAPSAKPEVARSPTGSTDPYNIVGTTQDIFEVERVVAHGGFGIVYRANHLRFAAPVALKCLKIPLSLTQQERDDFLERFRKEGELMFRLSSSIAEIVRPVSLDTLKLNGKLVPYIALEWLDGETVKDVIVRRLAEKKRPLPLKTAVILLAPVARALSRAHHFPGPDGALTIVHCDLKPDNIFVCRNDGGHTLKIFDFGIAKVRSAATRQAGGATVSSGEQSMFTPAYAAPEQWTPDRFGQTGPWTDVFALALTLTELVTQRPAIDGSPTAMLTQCVDEKKRPTPKQLGLAIPDAVDAIFQRALAVDPKRRTQSVDRFWTELEETLGLPRTFGGGSGRMSLPAMVAFAPVSWDDEVALESLTQAYAAIENPAQVLQSTQSPSPTAGGTMNKGPAAPPELDLSLDLPPIGAPAPPVAAPAAAPAPVQRAATPALGDFDLALPVPPTRPPSSPPVAAHAAPMASPAPPAPAEAAMDLGAAFEIAGEVARPAPTSHHPTPASGAPQAASTPPGMPAGMPAGEGALPAGDAPIEPPPPSISNRERLQKAAAVAQQAATVAASTAATAAKKVATKALEVDESHRIHLEDPSTWVKPMMGPIVAMCAAIFISVVAVIVNKITKSDVKVMWISLPLMLAAIGFAVYRWIKITGRQE